MFSLISARKKLRPTICMLPNADGHEELVVPDTISYIVLIGDNFRIEAEHTCQYFVMNKGYELKTALYKLCMAFDRYVEWYDELQNELSGSQDLERLCEIGYMMLDNSVMIYDKKYRLVGSMVVENDTFESSLEEQGAYSVINADTLRKLMNDQEFQKSFRTRGADLCKASFYKFNVLFVNLGKTDIYEGRLTITNHLRPFRNGDFQIAEILADAIRVSMKNREARSDDLSRIFRAFVTELISGRVKEGKRLSDSLRLWHWKRRDRYLCLRAGLNPGDIETSAYYYICSKLETSLQNCCAVRYGGCIVAVICLSENGCVQETVEYLKSMLNGAVAACSVYCGERCI